MCRRPAPTERARRRSKFVLHGLLHVHPTMGPPSPHSAPPNNQPAGPHYFNVVRDPVCGGSVGIHPLVQLRAPWQGASGARGSCCCRRGCRHGEVVAGGGVGHIRGDHGCASVSGPVPPEKSTCSSGAGGRRAGAPCAGGAGLAAREPGVCDSWRAIEIGHVEA